MATKALIALAVVTLVASVGFYKALRTNSEIHGARREIENGDDSFTDGVTREDVERVSSPLTLALFKNIGRGGRRRSW